MDCDIVLLPDAKLATQAIRVSHELGEESGIFTLEEGKFYPHLSLYMLRLRRKDVALVTDKLQHIAAEFKSIRLEATRYDQERGYIVVDYLILPELCALQRSVITCMNPIRDGLMEKDRLRAVEATGIARRNYSMYGYKYIGDLFKPHLTLTRFASEDPIELNTLPDISIFDGRFTKIGLYELGVSNTCVRRFAEFSLLD